MTERWDNEAETGQPSPVRLDIDEGGIALLAITAETPEHAITTALCLLEQAHKRTGRDDPMAMAVAACAVIMNDATIMEAEQG